MDRKVIRMVGTTYLIWKVEKLLCEKNTIYLIIKNKVYFIMFGRELVKNDQEYIQYIGTPLYFMYSFYFYLITAFSKRRKASAIEYINNP